MRLLWVLAVANESRNARKQFGSMVDALVTAGANPVNHKRLGIIGVVC